MRTRKIIGLMLAFIFLSSSLSVCSLAAEKYKYVVLGDSIAFGSGLVNAFDACYGKMVADTCDFDYANHAVPGATTGELIDKLKERQVRSDLKDADIVSISIGGNDYLNNITDLMFDSIVKRDYTGFDIVAEGVYTNIKKITDTVLGLNPDAVILLQTLYNPMSGYLKPTYQQGADRVSAAVYRIEKEYPRNVAVVDVASALKGDERNFADDTMHPSAKGNRIIAGKVLEELRRLGFTDKKAIANGIPGIDVQLGPAVAQALDAYAFLLRAMAVSLDALYSVMK